MPGLIYPTEKDKLLKLLTKDDLEVIQRDYPFKKIRNAKLHELMQKGASCHVLAEFTGGLSKSTVHRIGQTGSNRGLNISEKAFQKIMIDVATTVDKFHQEILNILNTGGNANGFKKTDYEKR